MFRGFSEMPYIKPATLVLGFRLTKRSVRMANHGYMTITGKAQGLISTGCSTQDSIGNKCQAAHTDEIMVLSYSHNMANIGNINKPTHNPIIITKNVDKSSPLLAQALSSREEINCTISFTVCLHSACRRNSIPSRSRVGLLLT